MKKKEAKKLNKIDAQAVHKKRALITEKIRESFISTLPIIIIVAIMCLSIQPVPTGLLLSFLIGALLIIVGMGLFTLGADTSMTPIGSRMKLEFLIPARGLFGYRNEFLTDTKGEGIMASVFDSYAPYKGELARRNTGSLVASETGTSITYGLFNAQERGVLFIGAGVDVYEGMVVGQSPKQEDITVNVCKKKQLTNMRASGSDDALRLVPPKQMSLEQCLEFLADDELLEVTPKNLRIRKTILNKELRMKATHGNKKVLQ